ncbi:MAG: PSD1 and planctomycete cytochrome C domain-containing protein [Rubripirellula sp.]
MNHISAFLGGLPYNVGTGNRHFSLWVTARPLARCFALPACPHLGTTVAVFSAVLQPRCLIQFGFLLTLALDLMTPPALVRSLGVGRMAMADESGASDEPLTDVASPAGDSKERSNQADEQIDFARQILPILSDKCFVCHGPDTNDETDLRLDSFASASEDRGGYRAIDVQNPDDSELLIRIEAADDPMPPLEAEKQLSEGERELIARWVRQGGAYAKHWAFEPPVKSQAFGSQTEAIDALIREQLGRHGIDLADEAAPHVLARRAALVLTGLPPEPEILAEYLVDPSDDGYERLISQLLDSPRFGEHQGRYWLDAVRYGDTHGLHLDNRRGIYPYRDWVVRAMNENLPLDQFVTWQVAGDLLPDSTLPQRIASGFVRLNPSTGEGGAIPAEFQMKNNFDRVETVGTVFLGMSLTCARCHTHKYDPIEQTEYYRLLSFFNSTAEPAMDGNSYTYGPTVRVPTDQAAWDRWSELTGKADAVLADALEKVDAPRWLQYSRAVQGWSTSDWKLSKPESMADAFISPSLDSKALDSKTLDASLKWAPVTGFPGTISGRATRGKLPADGQVVWVSFELDLPKSQQIDLTLGGPAGSLVFLGRNNIPIVEKLDSGNRVVPLRLASGAHRITVGIRGAANLSELRIELSSPWDSLAKTGEIPLCSRVDQLRMTVDPMGPVGRDVDSNAAQIAAGLAATEANFTTTLVAKELAKPRATHLLKRGEYDLPVGEPLRPGVLSVMGKLPDGAPQNRRGLAAWLTSRDHPLVARVLVNRIWQRTFGHGLVRTPEEFGLQGEQPTHPELLDWLAVEMHEGNWNLKQTLRSMVLSKTFRQSSAWRDEVDDPENRLLARSSSYRLDAEILRDVGLWSSGLLDPHMGGEGVKPYQPSGMWTALAHPASNTKLYVRDLGERLYRRSLYVYWKRTSPHPMMTLFDAPDRESSCVRRSRTNTPLQSLGMFNETQRIEMGRGVASRLIQGFADDEARINELFRLIACRDAEPMEMAACTKLLRSLRDRYRNAPEDAQALLAVGDAKPDPRFKVEELAAWSQLATTVLASDIAILMY